MLAHVRAGNPHERTPRDLYIDALEILPSTPLTTMELTHRFPIFLRQRFHEQSDFLRQDYTIRFPRLDKA